MEFLTKFKMFMLTLIVSIISASTDLGYGGGTANTDIDFFVKNSYPHTAPGIFQNFIENLSFLKQNMKNEEQSLGLKNNNNNNNNNYNKEDFEQYDSINELENGQTYNIQNVRRRDGLPNKVSVAQAVRHQMESLNKETRLTFQSLCPSQRQTIFLNDEDSKYEYRPAQYDEVLCSHPFLNHPNYNKDVNKVCSKNSGFACIQLNRTIHLTKREIGSDNCWQLQSILVPSGCECMWPKHLLGDISTHHNVNNNIH